MVLIAVISSVGIYSSGKKARTRLIPHSSVGAHTSSNGNQWDNAHQVYDSPSSATEEFDRQLQGAGGYQEFAPCFDFNGKRIGEKAILLSPGPPNNFAAHRIIWTIRGADHSEFFSVEADSLQEARFHEGEELGGGVLCNSKK